MRQLRPLREQAADEWKKFKDKVEPDRGTTLRGRVIEVLRSRNKLAGDADGMLDKMFDGWKKYQAFLKSGGRNMNVPAHAISADTIIEAVENGNSYDPPQYDRKRFEKPRTGE